MLFKSFAYIFEELELENANFEMQILSKLPEINGKFCTDLTKLLSLAQPQVVRQDSSLLQLLTRRVSS